jgi:hypothetical protein
MANNIKAKAAMTNNSKGKAAMVNNKAKAAMANSNNLAKVKVDMAKVDMTNHPGRKASWTR